MELPPRAAALVEEQSETGGQDTRCLPPSPASVSRKPSVRYSSPPGFTLLVFVSFRGSAVLIFNGGSQEGGSS